MMETMLNKWYYEYVINKENCLIILKVLEGLNFVEVLGGKFFD